MSPVQKKSLHELLILIKLRIKLYSCFQRQVLFEAKKDD